MDIQPNSIGEQNADGTLKTEATNCALTGVPVLDEHHTKFMLDATHFVRVVSDHAHLLTDEVRAGLIASYAPKTKKPADTSAKEKQDGN